MKKTPKEEHAHKHGSDWLRVKGARTHNLKNLSVEMPRGAMTVITGLSGSGKSSLAFDTIFAEGQRRYVESLSAYARQFLNQMAKPDVDEISGLSPAISIDQKSRSNNPRSTVATVTEIYDYLRVLYARAGQPYCIHHDVPIVKLSKEEMIKMVLARVETKRLETGTPVLGVPVDRSAVTIYAPVVVGRKGEYYQLLYDLLGKGFERVVIDGKMQSLREKIVLDRNKRHDVDAVVDSIFVSEFVRSPAAARERLSEALELALKEANGLVKIRHADGTAETLSSTFVCPDDGASFPEVEPRLFSFNSPYGACPECHGIGTKDLWTDELCPVCEGKRLRVEALNVLISGKNVNTVVGLSIEDAFTFFGGLKFKAASLNDVADAPLREIKSRLKFMIDVGLEYLTLDRKAGTLSGGEAQRIRLASQIGSRLVGTLYILDEPTIGLHQRDNAKLIQTLKDLRDLGNTIIVVEHDEDTIRESDYLVDIGPGAGVHGGNVVAHGPMPELIKDTKQNSLTLQYLRGKKFIEVPEERRKVVLPAGRDDKKSRGSTSQEFLKIRGAHANNLKDVDVDIPLRRFTAVTGVSGSGKSSLVYDVLYKAVADKLNHANYKAGGYKQILGMEYVNRIINIDQSAIGRTPRSNPATYVGAWTHIRDLFANTEDARVRGYKPGRFSFNVPGGRCENCEGHGTIAIEMHFLPTVYVTCDVCKGRRFDRETLEVEYKGKNIYDVLQMTIEEAAKFFGDIPWLEDKLTILEEVGLGYLELGQSATTLSGGEAQRIKLAAELGKRDTRRTLYLLDEPTTGLHFADVDQLIKVLQRLVDRGNTIVVIEHNLDVIKTADWVIDLGPEGGARGGTVVAVGTPEEIVRKKASVTGEYLRPLLAK